MTTGRISKRSVDALKCKAGQDRAFLWDDALAGFGVTAFPSGKKVFVAQFRHGGRSRRVAIGDYGRLTPDEARSNAKKLLGAVEGGADPIKVRRDARGVRSFKEIADDFMRLHVGPKRKPRTAEEYRRLLDREILPAIGSRRILDVTRVDVARLHSRLSDHPHTANRCLALISVVWNWAAGRDEAEFSANPARGIERNAETGKERYLTGDELARLGDALRRAETVGLPWSVKETGPNAKHVPKGARTRTIDPFAVAAIRLLILTGARLREILHAKWDYVNFQHGVMLLPDSKTGKKTLYLSAAALAVLNDIPRLAGSPYIIPGDRPRKAPGTPKPSPAPRADLKKPWTAISRAAGFFEMAPATDENGKPRKLKSGKPVMAERSTVRLHDLRHSFASMGAGASLGLPIIGKLLGHSQPATTARYSHLDADPMRRAADIIGGQIAAAMAGNGGEIVPLKGQKRG